MTVAMVMGLSVPVMAANFKSYTAKCYYGMELVFDQAYAESKTFKISSQGDFNPVEQTVTLITAKAGSGATLKTVPGNDPFLESFMYMDYMGEGYRLLGLYPFFEGEPELLFEGDVIVRVNDNVYVRLEGTNVALDKIKPAEPVKPAKPAAQKAKANPTDSKVMVNGKVVAFDAYNINSNNYFKLRDVAQVVSGSAKQFAVTWDGSKNSINLVSGEAYASVGTELAKGDGKAKEATLNTSAIYKDGVKADLTAYTINGNNYFKLRDLGQAFDFNVAWDGANNCITIDTAAGYAK